MISRRNFLKRAAAVIAAPAIVQVANIMPVVARPPLVTPQPETFLPGCTVWDFSPGTVFKDLEGTIPALPGDPAALVKPVYDGGGFGPMVNGSADERPVLVGPDAKGNWSIEVDGVNDELATQAGAPLHATLGGPRPYPMSARIYDFKIAPQKICFDAD